MTEDSHSGIESRVLYLSERYLVINKLPGEATEGAGCGMTDLPRLLTEQYGTGEPSGTGRSPGEDLPFPVTAVHRLDVPVSGCVLFARTSAALKAASALFTGDARMPAEKRYWAVVETPKNPGNHDGLYPGGCTVPGYPAASIPGPLAESGTLVHWIYQDRRYNRSVAFDENGPGRKRGILRYRIAGQGEHYLFLEIELITGRHHQIRAQLAALGLHIKGDLKYGARRSEKNGGIRLHARSLAFWDPLTTEKIIRLTASPPIRDRLWEDFETCITGNPVLH
jgi:23S rRNA pseudouridine1911/1915/1917 synthase